MIRNLSVTVVALSAMMLLSACGSTAPAPATQGGLQTTVNVTNRNGLSMEISVIGPSRRVRLGRVPGGGTSTFTIPADLVSAGTALRFEMESTGATPVTFSEDFIVTPGEEVVLVIPSFR